MIDLGWNYSQLFTFHQLLVSPHWVDIKIKVLNLEHRELRDISTSFIEGSVVMDTTGDTTRSADVTLVDESHSLGLDPGDPGNAVFPTRMIQCWYCVSNVLRTQQFQVPLFTGPITKVDRDGSYLSVEALGKEVLASGLVWDGMTLNKGMSKHRAVVRIMSELGGESPGNMRIVDPGGVLREDLQIKRGSDKTPWLSAKNLMASKNVQLFYDGLGRLQGRYRGGGIVFPFSGAYLTTRLQLGYNLDSLKNAVQVKGGTPKGAKNNLIDRVTAPAGHPLSPHALQRYGVDRVIPEFVEDEDLMTQDDVHDRAKSVLEDRLLEAVTVAVDSVVVPHLEELDPVSYNVGGIYRENKLTKATIPLAGQQVMNLGYDGRVKLKRTKKKKKKTRGASDRMLP
jgi:hypothetical protein